MQSVPVVYSRQEPVTVRTPPFVVKFLMEVAIMSFKPSYKGLEREELRFNSELGWLAALAFAIVVVVASMHG